MSNHITLHVNLLPFVLSQDVKLFCSSVIENTTFVIFFFCCWPEFCVFFSAYTLKCQRCLPDISGRCTATEKTCPSPNDQCATRRISSFAGGVFHGALCFNCKKKKKVLHWPSFTEVALSLQVMQNCLMSTWKPVFRKMSALRAQSTLEFPGL